MERVQPTITVQKPPLTSTASNSPAFSWRRNLAFVWLAQLVTMLGFTFVFPFIPLFVHQLGVEKPRDIALWSGIAGSASGLAAFISGPIWGILGDRFGRRKNLLRSILGGAVVVGLTGLSPNVYLLVLFRFFTGAFSGTFSAAMALVASSTPRANTAYALAILQTSLAVASSLGPLIGGLLAEAAGFRVPFYVTGATLALAGMLVLFFVREQFQPPPPTSLAAPFKLFWPMATSRLLLPVLLILFLLQASQVMMFPVLPVFIKELGESSRGASLTGYAFAILGAASAISAFAMARLSGRLGLRPLLMVGCVGAGLGYLPLAVAPSVPFVFLLVGLVGLFQGGLVGAAAGLIALNAPRERHGAAYGALQSAVSLAFGLGPLIGGALATGLGLRSVFVAQSAAFFITAILVARLVRVQQPAQEAVEVQR